VPVTELRAGIIVGAGSAAFEVMRDMVYNLPVLTPPRWVARERRLSLWKTCSIIWCSCFTIRPAHRVWKPPDRKC
jgi:uncharacterized protein YbjT (DUF2867 family)